MTSAEALNLAAKCPCGHTANFHRTRAQQQWRLLNTSGKYTGQCKGAPTTESHCHCIASREDVAGVAKSSASVPLRDAPAPPVTVRREDYDALVAALKGVTDNPSMYVDLKWAADALIDNAEATP